MCTRLKQHSKVCFDGQWLWNLSIPWLISVWFWCISLRRKTSQVTYSEILSTMLIKCRWLICTEHWVSILCTTYCWSQAHTKSIKFSWDFLDAEHKMETTLLLGSYIIHKKCQQLVRNQQAYKFLRKIQGSPPYW